MDNSVNTSRHIPDQQRSLTSRRPAGSLRRIARHCRAVILATLACLSLLAACATTSVKQTSSRSALPVPVKSIPAVTVTIKNFAFIPSHFTVSPGGTVTVENEDQVVHTLTADNGAFNTGNVTDGIPATFTAPTRPGRYPFHCIHHRYMIGVLTVS